MSRYYIVLVALMIFSSCEKNIKVDLPEHQSQLVINSYTETDDTIRVQVGKSIGILKYKSNLDLGIPNANVTLFTNGVETETMKYDAGTGLYNATAIAAPGKNYSIKVSAAGYNTAGAISEVPAVVKITSVKHFLQVRQNEEGMSQDEIRIQFTDPPGKGDFYIVRLTAPEMDDTFSHHYGFGCVNTTDASVESIYNESIDQNTCLSADDIFFRDDLFNGSVKELRLFVNSGSFATFINNNGDTVYNGVELYHVPEAHFRYLKSYRFASENIGNPFAEPTNVYSNIQNGYGIFSIVSHDYMDIK